MPTAHTSSPTQTLALGDTVKIGGKAYKVDRCGCGVLFTLRDDNDNVAFNSGHETLESITKIVREQFAKLLEDVKKEVPALAAGQKWRTRGGDIVTVRQGSSAGEFIVTGRSWWYTDHRSGSKQCHTPGVLHDHHRDSHSDTLVELIEDVAKPAQGYGLFLTKDEAETLLAVTRCISGTPDSRRAHTDRIGEKLHGLGVYANLDDLTKGSVHFKEEKPKPAPIFKKGEVWKGKNGHMLRIEKVDEEGVGMARVIHSPKGAFRYNDDHADWRIMPDGSFGEHGNKSDNLALVAKVSD